MLRDEELSAILSDYENGIRAGQVALAVPALVLECRRLKRHLQRCCPHAEKEYGGELEVLPPIKLWVCQICGLHGQTQEGVADAD